MQPAAAEDEGGNWIELRYGPLSLSDSSISAGSAGYGVLVGDYHLSSTSEAINKVACNQSQNTRTDHDFDGLFRPVPACPSNGSSQTNYDIGADEYGSSQQVASPLQVSPANWSPSLTGTAPNVVRTQVITITNPGTTAVNVATQFVATGSTTQQQISIVFGVVPNSSTCANGVPPGGNCQITIRFGPSFLVSRGTYTGSFQVNGDPSSSVSLSGTK
jgi:hypothetical protein